MRPFCWLVLMASVFQAGCGGKKLHSTTGSVTLDGHPVEEAIVQFQPEGAQGEVALALSKNDGAFRLYTGKENGAAAGEYRVTVVKFDKAKGKQSILPRKYSSPKTTPFRFAIPHDGPILLELNNKEK
jgi:hypothetical protein